MGAQDEQMQAMLSQLSHIDGAAARGPLGPPSAPPARPPGGGGPPSAGLLHFPCPWVDNPHPRGPAAPAGRPLAPGGMAGPPARGPPAYNKWRSPAAPRPFPFGDPRPQGLPDPAFVRAAQRFSEAQGVDPRLVTPQYLEQVGGMARWGDPLGGEARPPPPRAGAPGAWAAQPAPHAPEEIPAGPADGVRALMTALAGHPQDPMAMLAQAP